MEMYCLCGQNPCRCSDARNYLAMAIKVFGSVRVTCCKCGYRSDRIECIGELDYYLYGHGWRFERDKSWGWICSDCRTKIRRLGLVEEGGEFLLEIGY